MDCFAVLASAQGDQHSVAVLAQDAQRNIAHLLLILDQQHGLRAAERDGITDQRQLWLEGMIDLDLHAA